MVRPIILLLVFTAAAAAQSPASPFPGVSPEQLKKLHTAKRYTPLALPTWLPSGFKLEKVEMDLGPRVRVENKRLVIVYSRPVGGGKTQRFAIEAGFDGLGDLPYDTTKTIASGVGRIYLAYEPPDLDGGGNSIKDFAITEWFNVGRTPFHYIGMHGEEGDPSLRMLTLADTERILRSLRRF